MHDDIMTHFAVCRGRIEDMSFLSSSSQERFELRVRSLFRQYELWCQNLEGGAIKRTRERKFSERIFEIEQSLDTLQAMWIALQDVQRVERPKMVSTSSAFLRQRFDKVSRRLAESIQEGNLQASRHFESTLNTIRTVVKRAAEDEHQHKLALLQEVEQLRQLVASSDLLTASASLTEHDSYYTIYCLIADLKKAAASGQL